jgi:hypothetical protein
LLDSVSGAPISFDELGENKKKGTLIGTLG